MTTKWNKRCSNCQRSGTDECPGVLMRQSGDDFMSCSNWQATLTNEKKEKETDCYNCVYLDGDGCKKIPGPRMNTVWCMKWQGKIDGIDGVLHDLRAGSTKLRARVAYLEKALLAAQRSLQTIAGSYEGKSGMEDLVEVRQYAGSRARIAQKALEERGNT